MRVSSLCTGAAGRSGAALVLLSLAVLLSQSGVSTRVASTDALPFAKNFLVTGNYVVGSVDMPPQSTSTGFLTATIPMGGVNSVPAGADVLAAFLYWETISTTTQPIDGAKFRGQPITVAKAAPKVLTGNTASCWSSGGGSGATYTMTMFRADVLRLLPMETDAQGNKTGRLLVNDADLSARGLALNTVTLPEAGTGNQVPSTAGASLFVVYRDATQPLTSISLYDGIFVQAPGASMTQSLRGFLQSSATHVAKMTHIVGSGANNSSDRLLFKGTVLGGDVFQATSSPSSDRAWTARTDNVTSLMPGTDSGDGYGETVSTTVDHTKTNPYDCLSWAAIVFSTTVKDDDADGLPDKLESVSGMLDPSGQPLPDLYGMGARTGQKDLMLEVGAMKAAAGTTYGGAETDTVGHNHLPTPAVIKLVGDSYLAGGVHLHVDAGPGYHSIGGAGSPYASLEADDYIVSSALARGGESIAEVPCQLTVPDCQFPGYPGTVSWKIGYQFYRDAPVDPDGIELPAAAMDACVASGACRSRFDQNRLNFFHYILYAHAKGKPKCAGTTPAEQAACVEGNPDFHVPSSSSGSSDLPGGDSMVTMGFWGNGFVGTDFAQASTTMHELGHSMWRTHGGDHATFVSGLPVIEPNCKPNYLSAMNYLFQLSGLRDDDGVPHLNYSGSANSPIDETAAASGVNFGYHTAWYAPFLGSSAQTLGVPKAKKFCNGASFPDGVPPGGVEMARFEGTSFGLIGPGGGLDLNFDGTLSSVLRGSNDWASLRLDQVGSRRNMAGFSLSISHTSGVDFVGGAELDRETAAALGNTPANQFKACILGINCPSDSAPLHRVKTSWNTPNVGTVAQYAVYRVQGNVLPPPSGWGSPIGLVPVPAGSTTPSWSYVDTTELPNGIDFLYFVVAQFTDGTSSGASNTKVINAVNDAPAVAPSFTHNVGQGGSLTVPARGVLAGSSDSDSADASIRALIETGPSHAATFTLNTDGSFTYTPQASFSGVDTFTFHADSGSWPPGVPRSVNSNSSTVTLNVTDATPPVVTLTVPAPTGNNGWFKTSPVTLTVLATDASNVSAISCADGAATIPVSSPGFGTPNATGTFNVSAEGTHNLTCTATDGKGNTGAAAGSANTGSLKIDTVAPVVSITAPLNNGTYVLNASVAANYGCTDSPGSGLATCAGSLPNGSNISTSPVGPQTFTVTASDNAGNVATRVNAYWVVYNFILTPPKTTATLGSAVPLSWQLTDALGAVLSDLTSLVKLTSYFTGQPSGGSCSTNYTATSTNTAVLYSPATGATGGSDFRFLSPTFRFNWDTSTATSTGKGCYVVVWQLKDNAGAGPTFSILNSSLLKKVAIQLK